MNSFVLEKSKEEGLTVGGRTEQQKREESKPELYLISGSHTAYGDCLIQPFFFDSWSLSYHSYTP